jgi:DNA polymerase III alpha subunit (gram-positive type)
MRDLKGRSIISFPRDYVVLDIETTGLDTSVDEIRRILPTGEERTGEAASLENADCSLRMVGRFPTRATETSTHRCIASLRDW